MAHPRTLRSVIGGEAFNRRMTCLWIVVALMLAADAAVLWPPR